MKREPILQALFDLISAMPGLVTKSRTPRHWSDVSKDDRPAMFMGAGDQIPQNDSSGKPAIWTMEVEVYLYVTSTDSKVPPSALLNEYLDRLEALLMPAVPGAPWPTGGAQTLGGLVRHVWISGPITTSKDVLTGGQGVAIVPLEIVAV
jgi:hypothetical protein